MLVQFFYCFRFFCSIFLIIFINRSFIYEFPFVCIWSWYFDLFLALSHISWILSIWKNLFQNSNSHFVNSCKSISWSCGKCDECTLEDELGAAINVVLRSFTCSKTISNSGNCFNVEVSTLRLDGWLWWLSWGCGCSNNEILITNIRCRISRSGDKKLLTMFTVLSAPSVT